MITRSHLFHAAVGAASLCSASSCLAQDAGGALQISTTQEISSASFTLIEHRWAAFRFNATSIAKSPLDVRALRRSPLPGRHAARDWLLPSIREAESRHRLPAGLLDAMIAIESAYLTRAVSRAGAAGLAQLMPATARKMGVSDRFDPLQSIEGGARYLRSMLDQFGSVSLALAAYNAGPRAVARAGGIPLNRETPAYVGRVMRLWLSLAQESA